MKKIATILIAILTLSLAPISYANDLKTDTVLTTEFAKLKSSERNTYIVDNIASFDVFYAELLEKVKNGEVNSLNSTYKFILKHYILYKAESSLKNTSFKIVVLVNDIRVLKDWLSINEVSYSSLKENNFILDDAECFGILQIAVALDNDDYDVIKNANFNNINKSIKKALYAYVKNKLMSNKNTLEAYEESLFWQAKISTTIHTDFLEIIEKVQDDIYLNHSRANKIK